MIDLDIKIYDTLSQKKQFLNKNRVSIYLCGITPYEDSHIGHSRTIIVFDVLRRYLESQNVEVKIVQNFTDVDDKIIQRSIDENSSIYEVSNRFIKHYHRDFDLLNVKHAHMYPKATDHINDIINFITQLINKNVAYITKHGVYFSILKFNEYGKLSKKNIDKLLFGTRVSVDYKKSTPYDFALWKFVTTPPIWNSPWGKGRPGWHIECSVMSSKYLQPNFEIHGGGRDLIFPHHENEIAQYESCMNTPLAKIWMHVGVIKINNTKMSKSLNNVIFLHAILEKYDPNIIRLFCISTHYSKPINYNTNSFEEAKIKWDKIKLCYYELLSEQNFNDCADVKIDKLIHDYDRKFHDSLNNNFNTVLALSSFLSLVKQLNFYLNENSLTKYDVTESLSTFQKFFKIFGFKIPITTYDAKNLINSLIKKRKILREHKKYYEADQVRQQLENMNISLLDYQNRTVWMKK